MESMTTAVLMNVGFLEKKCSMRDRRIRPKGGAPEFVKRASRALRFRRGGDDGFLQDLRIAPARVVFLPALRRQFVRRHFHVSALLLEVIKRLGAQRDDMLRSALRRELLRKRHQLAAVSLALVFLRNIEAREFRLR